jgi:hypothetical protein
MQEPDVGAIHRRQARSGVSYADPVVLHDTRQTRIVLVPFFIPHSDHTELAVKLTTYKKRPPPHDWVIVEEKSISLKESAARALLEALKQHLRVTDQQDGDYLVIPVSEHAVQASNIEPTTLTRALSGILGRQEIAEYLASANLNDEMVSAFRGAIRLNEMQSAVAELRQHLDGGETREEVYQKWCETHTWAFGNAYVMRDSVREISPGDKLDLLLPSVLSGYRDVVELKRPDMPVLNYDSSHRNYYFSADVSKALGQVHRYLDVLHEAAAKGLRDHPEIVAYHPRGIIVIGRSKEWGEEQLQALHGLNTRLTGVMLMTYDQLLAQGERLLDFISSEQADLFNSPEPDPWDEVPPPEEWMS